jgi:hypothetical protein
VIFVYSYKKSQRLKYTLDVLLKNILQVEYKLVDKATFIATTKPKINYSEEDLPATIWIKPHTLLFETDIDFQDIRVTHSKGIPYFFKTSDILDFQFDILASAFYMLTRYEEYLPFTPDIHGRFTAIQSLAYTANFLQKPVVHLWAKLLQDTIVQQHPAYIFPKRDFTQHNTIDIDVAYACKGKPFWRKTGSIVKKLINFYYKATWQTVPCTDKDLYDTYDILKEIQEYSNVNSTYFFQVGKYGKYDKNLPLNKTMQNLIKRTSSYANIGLHPSYNSNKSIAVLQKEVKNLVKILDKPLIKSRQHYLKMSLPDTYENLITVGIQEDYTMGFADQIGFRSGMALPYPFFNLNRNEQRPLSIVPFQIMDGTLKDYLKLTPDEATLEIQTIKKAVQDVNGQLVTVFHNSFLIDKDEWKGWLAVYSALFDRE